MRNEINFALNNHVPFLAVHLTETELVKGLALRMGDIQAVLKHRMSPESYWRKMEKVLPGVLREMPELEPVVEEEPAPQWVPEPADAPQSTWQQPAPALSVWQRVLQLPRRPLLIGAASVVSLGVIVPAMMNRTPKPEGYVEPPRTVLPLNVATVTKDSPWTNTLGMKFVPSGTPGVLMSIWETRVQDYEAFAKAMGRAVEKCSFTQDATHPVVNVSWLDAKAFCDWLSTKEGKTYRLPTDAEWSTAVGLRGETGATPKGKDLKAEGYPWGTQFPPPKSFGNYSSTLNVDSFEYTAPVGSFPADKQTGIYDLSGNVWEWCDDWYDTDKSNGTLRGGSWVNRGPEGLRSSYRDLDTPVNRYNGNGFRCVVGVGASGR